MRIGIGIGVWPGGAASAFTPAALFAAGATGGWWDATSLNDKSGAGRTLSLTGTAPTPQTSGSLNYKQFVGLGTLSATFTQPSPMTRISLLRQTAWASKYLLSGIGTNVGLLAQNGTTPQITLYDQSFGPSSTDLVLSTWAVVTEVFNGASSKLAVNNAAYATGDASNATIGGFAVGGPPGNSGLYATMDWAESIVINGVASDADIAKIRTYLGAKAALVL